MKDITDEFSFILRPSEFGIGVFAVHDIKEGTYLRLFGAEDGSRLMDKSEVPEIFRDYCVDHGDKIYCPEDFGRLQVGWYLNHSKNPNAKPDENYSYYAKRDIKAGEEITVDYNLLNEPEEAKKDYYK